ncbi:TIGR03943 family putative permease subunit [Lacisediminihabitans sp.]|jgi:uncharacterized repeat protein (TIGR03943 family)|uniref:TIGR03943 family putative permease subunit n=1 Tax=Lacisediminihabitans sp. TaxID=2787631 RepID=UPI002F93DFFF
MWLKLRRARGIVLCIAALVSTVWLALTNQLILYIHPRYIVFTVIMAAVGLAIVVASLARRPDHDHDEQPVGWRAVVSNTATVSTLVLAAGLIVVPPATLTTATADQRVINSTNVGQSSKTLDSAAVAPANASARFSVADWASLLRQTTDSSFYRNKPVDVTGFVTADKDDANNIFYVSRFVITCCAVDAQPVGVPVYLPDWRNALAPNQWVQVKGEFDSNPSRSSQQPVVIVPASTAKVEQPSEPYLY